MRHQKPAHVCRTHTSKVVDYWHHVFPSKTSGVIIHRNNSGTKNDGNQIIKLDRFNNKNKKKI